MKNNEIHKTVQSDFLKNVSEILLQARKNAKTAVNLSMVYAYYEIGRMIVEEEQHGANRAAYGNPWKENRQKSACASSTRC